jgi:hypothetical protein
MTLWIILKFINSFIFAEYFDLEVSIEHFPVLSPKLKQIRLLTEIHSDHHTNDQWQSFK